MKLRWPLSLSAPATPAAGVLLVQPLQALWLDATGQTQLVPPPADQPVRVVADLIEETHVAVEVPPLMGSDRSGFIQVQLQNLLPEGQALDVAAAYNNVSRANVFGLIHALGAESAGALRFLPEGKMPSSQAVPSCFGLA